MRRFVLVRREDVTGVSGTGIVAEGVEFSDGRIAMQWTTNGVHAIVIHENLDALLSVHGHNGRTTVQFVDDQSIITEGATS